MSDVARLTPRDILAGRNELSDDVVAVRTGGRIVDLHTPVDPSVPMTVIRRTDPDGLEVIRHSTSHVLAQAVQKLFPGTQVTIGPAIDSGFYYDFHRTDGTFTDQDLLRIEKEMRKIMSQNLPFSRRTMSRDAAIALFEGLGETFKVELIRGIPANEDISVYYQGKQGKDGKPEAQWFDLCAGPHVQSTKQLGVVKLTSVAGAYWRGDERNPMLQRIYGTAFATEEELAAHLKMLEEARARDHRKLGKELELFTFHEAAPAMPFFLPKGAFVYNALIGFIRELYVDYGYDEVITPQILDKRVFETSGHLPNYRENMYFPATTEALDGAAEPVHPALDALGQKPMNCPGHCLIFGQRKRSYRELPWRVADFGRLHRYERGGVVHGLTRVRSFCQDDAHIFCTPEQLKGEIFAFNKLLFETYAAFGFKDVSVKLALRPEKRIGTEEAWDLAENTFADVLKESNIDYEALPGEGAFYGPKLEFHVKDAIGRGWQLGTVQLDPFLPERFDLGFIGQDGAAHRPVMLHRAILGSLERFFGIYIEHTAGKFPVWIAPEQATLLTVTEGQSEYAHRVQAGLRAQGLRVGLDDSRDKLGAKIRNARLSRVPYFAVIGDKEVETESVAPKTNDGTDLGVMPASAFLARLLAESKAPRLARSELS